MRADTATFLVALALLLLTARVLGALAVRIRLPAVVGELMAGVLLGPTVLGRLHPDVMQLFHHDAPSQMHGAVTLLGGVALLTVAGTDVDLADLSRRWRTVAWTSTTGMALPLLGGAALGWWLAATRGGTEQEKLLLAGLVGAALLVSAIPVIAKTLLDLGLLRSEFGAVVLAAAVGNDLVAWLLFSLVAESVDGAAHGWRDVLTSAAGLVVFTGGALWAGHRLLPGPLAWLESRRLTAPGHGLAAVVVLGCLGAGVMQLLDVHYIFGAFVVGLALGRSRAVPHETRSRLREVVHSVMGPLFFASVGTRVDFLAALDPLLVALVVGVGCVVKLVGCSAAARASGADVREAWAVGFGMNARGAMGMVFAMAALEAGLIDEPLFVALLLMALVTSLMAGPAMGWLMRGNVPVDLVGLISRGAFVPRLRGATPEQAVRHITEELAAGTPLDPGALADEIIASQPRDFGALSDGVALVHARVDGLFRPMLGLGVSTRGIDFQAPDGVPAGLVFLLLLPRHSPQRALELHSAIVRSVVTAPQREALRGATSRQQVVQLMGTREARKSGAHHIQ
ncbi:MAG: cation:proton antiporter [Myxococcota bacterium]